MTHEELIEKMCAADCETQNNTTWEKTLCDKNEWRKGMSAALRVAVEEFRLAVINRLAANNGFDIDTVMRIADEVSSRLLKPKSDPAVEAAIATAREIGWVFDGYGKDPKTYQEMAKIVAAVRNTDKEPANAD